ncbi:pleckstrin homology domain-containing family F member 2 isoform X2 [Ictidomys tridecemlineatus]|uniref:pleckstrin homology domain-containing family F member 2 isoform X2 n=1 Tax=Ictidomys tridecemlineatus TaxID=43179 RepID=UPI001A9D4BB1|nr:pleckstrin homology domain-containing family F member 2 isoform X2 [Ictidomys tridecemlineatus]
MGEAGPGGGSRVRLEGRGSHLRAAAPAGCPPRPERAGCAGPQAAHTQRGRAWELAESAPGVCDEESDLRATAVARARPGKATVSA